MTNPGPISFWYTAFFLVASFFILASAMAGFFAAGLRLAFEVSSS